jgi:uncharacterized cupin superfamily protein
MDSDCRQLLRAAEVAKSETVFSHPWNPKSEIYAAWMGRTLGLKRTGVSLVRLMPGKESFVYHAHQFEEEWVYILSGRGQTEIDGKVYEVGGGDFMAFPTPSVAHQLSNPFDEPVVYLMGGESREFEVADFPGLGKRIVRRGSSADVYNIADAQPFIYTPPKKPRA